MKLLKVLADESQQQVTFDHMGSVNETFASDGHRTSESVGDSYDWGCTKQEYIAELLEDGFIQLDKCEQCDTPFDETEGPIHALEYVTDDNSTAHVCNTCYQEDAQ